MVGCSAVLMVDSKVELRDSLQAGQTVVLKAD
jgi:hypothetical protein